MYIYIHIHMYTYILTHARTHARTHDKKKISTDHLCKYMCTQDHKNTKKNVGLTIHIVPAHKEGHPQQLRPKKK